MTRNIETALGYPSERRTHKARVAAAEPDPHAHRVQTLRGMACLLLVAFHVVIDSGLQGIDPRPDSIYKSFAAMFAPIRMPLFIFLSGYVYAWRPARRSAEGSFVFKKLRRLLLPFLTVTTAFAGFQYVTGSLRPPGHSLIGIYLYTYAHFWFLQSLMLIFVAVFSLEKLRAMQTLGRYLAVMMVALLAHFFVRIDPNVFSITQAFYLLPFFLLGVGANRFRQQFEQPVVQAAVIGLFLFAMTVHVLACFHIFSTVSEQRTLLATTISVTACLTLIYRMPGSKWLRKVGFFSFAIYLLHVFFTTTSRMALTATGVVDPFVFFCVATGCGIAGPVLVELILRRQHVLRRMVLGQV